MNLIFCTDPCIYQTEGHCTLSMAVSAGRPTDSTGCVHYLPRTSQQDRQRLPNIPHRNEL